MSPKNILIFGATGSIGQNICNHFYLNKWNIYGVTRQSTHIKDDKSSNEIIQISIDDLSKLDEKSIIKKNSINAIIWAQGKNLNDSIFNIDFQEHIETYEANVLYIIKTLKIIIETNILAPNCRMCIVSSIWQNIARTNKLSYMTTKSALQGLVQSLMIDLAPNGYLINAVLPGAIDTPMTRENLNNEQIKKIKSMTPQKELSNMKDVTEMIYFLCSTKNTSITGQFLTVDGGFSNAKIF